MQGLATEGRGSVNSTLYRAFEISLVFGNFLSKQYLKIRDLGLCVINYLCENARTSDLGSGNC